MIQVKFIVLAETAEFTLTDIDPLSALLIKRRADGAVAFVEDYSDAKFWVAVITSGVATPEVVAKYLTFVNPNE